MPVISKKVKERILDIVRTEFGGNMYEVIVGGAGLNKEIEDFLVNIGFPITYGLWNHGDGSSDYLIQTGMISKQEAVAPPSRIWK